MLPVAYATPAAVVFLVGGLLACFAGYRLFRVVLGLYGFIIGAAVTASMMGQANTFALVVAAIVGGLVGALLMVAAYFIGVGLIGAGLAALALTSGWHTWQHAEPPTALLVVVAVLGALLALSVVRYVVVFGTAIGGSWSAITGALALAAHRAPGRVSGDGFWSAYPPQPLPGQWWFYATWFALALGGALVQMSTTTKLGAKKAKAK
jgi:hypothetical protein